MNTKKIIVIIVLIAVILAIMKIEYDREPGSTLKTYSSKELGISFSYPEYYFLEEKNEENRRVLILTEDTEENRLLREGLPENTPGRDGPVAITFQVFPNTKNQTAKDWVKDSTSSNFRLSTDGKIEETIISNKIGARYSTTGLYEAKNVVITVKNYILMVSGTYIDPTDRIISDYEAILKNIHIE